VQVGFYHLVFGYSGLVAASEGSFLAQLSKQLATVRAGSVVSRAGELEREGELRGGVVANSESKQRL
jgi:hypothetical protein